MTYFNNNSFKILLGAFLVLLTVGSWTAANAVSDTAADHKATTTEAVVVASPNSAENYNSGTNCADCTKGASAEDIIPGPEYPELSKPSTNVDTSPTPVKGAK